MLDVAVRDGVGRRLAVGALAAGLELELRLCRFPDCWLEFDRAASCARLDQLERFGDAARASKRRRNGGRCAHAFELGHRGFSSAVLMSAINSLRRLSRSGITLQSGRSRRASPNCSNRDWSSAVRFCMPLNRM